jgi:hypothetical protein
MMRNAGAERNRANAHVTIKDVPAFVGSVGRAAAGEGGHQQLAEVRKATGHLSWRPYILSEIQVLLPHWQSNIWNIRPVGGSGMLVVNFGCSPHFKQGGEVGLGRSCCFCMPHKIPGSHGGQVNYWIRNQVGASVLVFFAYARRCASAAARASNP